MLGGISVSISTFLTLASVEQRNRMTGLTFGLPALIGTIGFGGATFKINRKKGQDEEGNHAKSVFYHARPHNIRTPTSAAIALTAIAPKNAVDPECPTNIKAQSSPPSPGLPWSTSSLILPKPKMTRCDWPPSLLSLGHWRGGAVTSSSTAA
ncbi:hypothetical protein [uncultured Bilophila sp.]|uniref:hypothetical protein n=1 Tax=uncultured Bilophila sp. TaxID=529385 RepID=UPI00280A70D5|nr:hypothetical protein [uncultured Bilophila sp.]